MKLLLLFVAAILMVGCDKGMDGDQQAREAAGYWADAFFNCDYKDASKYATPESLKWLQFAASNTTEQDLKLLQEAGGAVATASDWFEEANDTLRVVTLSVTNFLKPVTKSQNAILQKEGTFKVTVVKRDTDWLVKMEGLPRSEKQNRD